MVLSRSSGNSSKQQIINYSTTYSFDLEQKPLAKLQFLVPTARLELAQPKPLPPQDSVSTNFTTSAYSKTRQFYCIAQHKPPKNLGLKLAKTHFFTLELQVLLDPALVRLGRPRERVPEQRFPKEHQLQLPFYCQPR